ncbi:hypothetical protein TEA_002765 [Camellia sinensis var. sinensis]|uniref:Uncharacterized protein n=1 Tax=Camellia sinensis var. sinensis TaxID=542762 RepID=A0A4S4EI75_CAMSN|nr:hypothetical protein TEA_002765 [Camellia sinensis var. sinensis]
MKKKKKKKKKKKQIYGQREDLKLSGLIIVTGLTFALTVCIKRSTGSSFLLINYSKEAKFPFRASISFSKAANSLACSGFVEPQEKPGILSTIFRYSEPVNSPTISLEALQGLLDIHGQDCVVVKGVVGITNDWFIEEEELDFQKYNNMKFSIRQIGRGVRDLSSHFEVDATISRAVRAVSHNYPDIIVVCWEQVSSTVLGFLRLNTLEVPTRPWKDNIGKVVGSIGEKVMTAAIKVLDECLRAISGFKGTEDLFDDKLFDTPFTSDYTRIKKISSAPSYGSESLAVTKDEPEGYRLGSEQWSEAIEKHMPLVLQHSSAMVRAASVTCFAGITSFVFSSLPKEKQDFILTSSVNAALNDEVSSVRSAACRAIGVITCFPQIAQRNWVVTSAIWKYAIQFPFFDCYGKYQMIPAGMEAGSAGIYMDWLGLDLGLVFWFCFVFGRAGQTWVMGLDMLDWVLDYYGCSL